METGMDRKPQLGNITLSTSSSLADPAHLIRWSVRNPDAGPYTPSCLWWVNSGGTRWQRFLIWMLTKSIRATLQKGVR